jgi:hypothetical protein
MLRSKFVLAQPSSVMPRHPGEKPRSDDTKALRRWQSKADKFAAYMLVAFMPWDLETKAPPVLLNYESLRKWANELKQSDLFVDKHRLRQIQNHASGFTTSKKMMEIMTFLRFRESIPWDQQNPDDARLYSSSWNPNPDIDNAADDSANPKASNNFLDANNNLDSTTEFIRTQYDLAPKADVRAISEATNISDTLVETFAARGNESRGGDDLTASTQLQSNTQMFEVASGFWNQHNIDLSNRIIKDMKNKNSDIDTDVLLDDPLSPESIDPELPYPGLGLRPDLYAPLTNESDVDDVGFTHEQIPTSDATLNEKQNEFYSVIANYWNAYIMHKRNSTLYPKPNPDYVFLEGGPGTGKTEVINRILAKLSIENYISVALTGSAASNIAGASTIHSGFSIPFCSSAQNSVTKAGTQYNISRAAFLIIDEMSLLPGKLAMV